MAANKVLVGIPTRGTADIGCLAFTQRMMERGAPGTEAHVKLESFAAATIARNSLAAAMMDGDYSHVMFIDDDTLVPAFALRRLLGCDAPIATGLCPILRRGEGVTNVQLERGGDFLPCWPDGRFEVAAAGTACMLIRREVFERLEWPWFTYYQARGNGEACSEDLPFCWHAIDAGFKIIADASVICDHIKPIGLLQLCPPLPEPARTP